MCIALIIITVITSVVPAFAKESESTGIIYIGDSRTVNIQNSLNNEKITYIAEVGMGYSWFTSTAIPTLQQTLENSNNIKFIVIAMGYNDLAGTNDGNVDKYINAFNDLIIKYSNINFFFMSVNPVEEEKEKNIAVAQGGMAFISNSDIMSFNEKLQNGIDEKFIDVYNSVDLSAYSTSDGVHYTADTSILVHEQTINYIQSHIFASGSYTFLDSYPNRTEGTEWLSQPIVEAIGQENIDSINNAIIDAVEKAGKCTKTAAAAAGVTLAYNLYELGYRLPYYWGGGHDSLFLGISTRLGTSATKSCSNTTCYYTYGFDCSGFVNWASNQSLGQTLGVHIYPTSGYERKISFEEAEPGDVLANSGHVILIIENKGDYLQTLESTGSPKGLIFTTYTPAEASAYSVYDTSEYYERKCQL